MADFRDFKREDGSIDWRAADAADIADGSHCYQCRSYIVWSKGTRALCSDCASATEDKELSHDKFLRCPKCRNLWDPWEAEDYGVLTDDTHEVYCTECDHKFEVSTTVQYTFTSPPMIKEDCDAA